MIVRALSSYSVFKIVTQCLRNCPNQNVKICLFKEPILRFYVFGLALLIGGCAAPSEFYSPDVRQSEKVSVGACGHLFATFRRELADGVVLEFWPYSFLLRVEGNNAFRLISSTIQVLDEDQNLLHELEILKITTGVFFSESYSEEYGIEEQDFGPLETIQGTGRYEATDTGKRIWSPWVGKSDIFRLQLSEYPEDSTETLFLDLPDIFVNEKLIEIEPIKFEWVSRRAIACI